MSVSLLDVNVLISLLDSAHAHHAASVAWFRKSAATGGWATCPLTENGFVRVVSHLSYPNLRLSPALAAESLALFVDAFPETHHFWPDEITVSNPSIFDLSVLIGSRQITDAYLAGLAFHNAGCLVTLDRSIAWQAIRGATAALVERIPT